MRIAIINVTGGGMSGGYRTYLRNVLPRLAAHPNIEAILCATPPSVGVEAWFPPLPSVSFIPCAPFRFLHHRPDYALKKEVVRFAPEVIFIPVERYLRFPGIPLVVMLQNMGPLAAVAGNPLSERLRYVAQRHETRVAVQRADHVIVPTNFVREFLTEKWHISTQKVMTIHYGSNTPTESIMPRKPPAIPEAWAGKFLFAAGSIEPYRGLEDVLDAMRHLPRDAAIVGLVIAGEARLNMAGYQKHLQKWIERRGLEAMVYWTDALLEEEMSWCYRNCLAFVMTSRLESFGMIGLEALAHGCISVVADNPPLPEIFDNSTLYYNPRDSVDLVKKISQILDWDDVRRQHASTAARDRASQFSWDNNIQAMVAVFKEVIQKKRAQTRGWAWGIE